MPLTDVEKIKLVLVAGSNIAQIEKIIKRIEGNAISEYKEEIRKKVNFIDVDMYDVVTDVTRKDGTRGYSLMNSLEGAVMVPDRNGYWMPYCDKDKAT